MSYTDSQWVDLSPQLKQYHLRQFTTPYRSTVAFCSWLEAMNTLGPDYHRRIADLGTGASANIYYLAKRYAGAQLLGIDINRELIALGNQRLRNDGLVNASLEWGDLFNLPGRYRSMHV